MRRNQFFYSQGQPLLGKNNNAVKGVSRQDAKTAKNGKNTKAYCLIQDVTGISLRALRLSEKMLCFVP
jgi:hypothetical protein